jgi:hypothetical protein
MRGSVTQAWRMEVLTEQTAGTQSRDAEMMHPMVDPIVQLPQPYTISLRIKHDTSQTEACIEDQGGEWTVTTTGAQWVCLTWSRLVCIHTRTQ